MCDKYAPAFGKGLKLMNPTTINLSNNRLNVNGSLSILKALNPGIEEIDLSNNKLGLVGIEYLCKGISSG